MLKYFENYFYVIASEAKHPSTLLRIALSAIEGQSPMGLLRRFTPRNDKKWLSQGIIYQVLFLLINLIGCTSEFNLATQREESLMYGTDKEVKIGDAVSHQFEEHFQINMDVDVNERVEKILDKLVTVCDRKDIIYSIKVVDEEKLNALSLPGGYIYVYKGLIDKLKSDDQLACVIAHEVGHITARHAIKKLQASYGYALLQLLAIQSGSGKVAQGVNTAFLSLFLAYSRQDEFQADKLGIKYTKLAGYHAEEMIDVLKVLQEEGKKEPAKEYSYWRTHPYLSERISMVNTEIKGDLEFKDYLNIMGGEDSNF